MRPRPWAQSRRWRSPRRTGALPGARTTRRCAWGRARGSTRPGKLLLAGATAVAIDPGMAFGTGSHATTALCLERCDELLAEFPGADVLDVGTGSGVIALLAKKLGARRVAGTKNDPVALAAARSGEALNGISGVEWMLCDDPSGVPGEFRIVIANILLNPLVELAPALAVEGGAGRAAGALGAARGAGRRGRARVRGAGVMAAGAQGAGWLGAGGALAAMRAARHRLFVPPPQLGASEVTLTAGQGQYVKVVLRLEAAGRRSRSSTEREAGIAHASPRPAGCASKSGSRHRRARWT